MSQVKDPKIKLFGKTIELPDTSASAHEAIEAPVSARCTELVTELQGPHKDPPCSSSSMLEDNSMNAAKDQGSSKSLSDPKEGDAKEEDRAQILPCEDSKDPNTSKPEDNQHESSDSQDKIPKKPDKILPCPRCNSMDTKFCYFNNYNVNQPRHFCKNCQRYWTAGGSMRNVPVGAGRRKNKNSASVSQFRHLAIPESLNPNGTVLTFSSDAPLCESMASVLNIADKTAKHGSQRNGFLNPEGLVVSVPGSKDSGTQLKNRSSGAETSSNDEMGRSGLNAFPNQVPYYPGATSWPYPWSPVQWNSQATFRPADFPVQFYSTPTPPPPPPYWGCAVPNAWNVPWIIPPSVTQSHSQSPSSSSGPNSPTLGKHSRDDSCLKPDNNTKDEESMKERSDLQEKSLWVPKTLRIDDPEEAAKSSIWATLGIKNDGASDSVNGSGLFKGFQGKQQSKGDEKKLVCESSTVLQANPAALSRSLNFHESS